MILICFFELHHSCVFPEKYFSEDENLILPRSYVKKHTLIPFFVTAKDIFQKEKHKIFNHKQQLELYTSIHTCGYDIYGDPSFVGGT